ncbi:MAG: hypothetical protein J5699_08005 [Bacteroidales bacterium]|nr:hypothetical protein [Bacteroidales bacterium]
MKKAIAVLFFALLCTGAFACTSVIITGKATKDGRPLMWKNTDGGDHFVAQRFSYHAEGKYAWLGLAQTAPNPVSAWFGVNEKGFAIMNTASHNLVTDPAEKAKRSNGYLMKEALDVCVTLGDFLHMLDTINTSRIKLKNRVVSSHYGVIDANGGAAYVETRVVNDKVEYWVFDVNDPEIAPDGWLVYSNWSVMGETDKGGGYIRKENAEKIFRECDDFTPRYIFDKGARCFYNNLIGVDYRALVDEGIVFGKGHIPDSDFIPRLTTYVSSVVQGVKPGENPDLITIWTAMGYPPTSVAIPAWVKGGTVGINPLLKGNPDNSDNCEICDMSLKLKTQIFDVKRGNGPNYLNFEKLYNTEGTGYIQLLSPVEQAIFDWTEIYLAKWRKAGEINTKEIAEINAIVEKLVRETPVLKDIPYEYKYGKITID